MKDVVINIKGIQFVDGEEDSVEITMVGKMGERNGKTLLMYEESDQITGAKTTNTLKIKGEESVTIVKSGGELSRMEIEMGRRNTGHYSTGHGDLMLGVFGEKLVNELNDCGGRFFARYTLDINSNLISRNELEISVQPANRRR